MLRQWNNCSELLDLFAVPNGEGRARFEDLCDLGAVLLRFGQVWTLGDLERAMMKELRLSPLVYWSCQKRAVAPLLAAGGDTLRALGVPVEGEPGTVHALALAVATAQIETITAEDRDVYGQLVERIGGLLRG